LIKLVMAAMQKNIIIIIIGIFWPLITYLRLGNLPGDIVIKNNSYSQLIPKTRE